MSYTIRRRLTVGSYRFFDTSEAEDAADAIAKAKKLCGIFKDTITVEIEQKIRELELGSFLRIRRPSIGFSMYIKRRKQ